MKDFYNIHPQEIFENISSQDAIKNTKINWLALAEHSNNQALKEKEHALLWAKICIKTNEILQKIYKHDTKFVYAQMHLRTYFIKKYYTKLESPLLNPQVILEWVENNIPISLEKAEELIQEIPNENNAKKIEHLKIFWHIRQKLKFVAILNEIPEIKISKNLIKWLEISPQIP